MLTSFSRGAASSGGLPPDRRRSTDHVDSSDRSLSASSDGRLPTDNVKSSDRSESSDAHRTPPRRPRRHWFYTRSSRREMVRRAETQVFDLPSDALSLSADIARPCDLLDDDDSLVSAGVDRSLYLIAHHPIYAKAYSGDKGSDEFSDSEAEGDGNGAGEEGDAGGGDSGGKEEGGLAPAAGDGDWSGIYSSSSIGSLVGPAGPTVVIGPESLSLSALAIPTSLPGAFSWSTMLLRPTTQTTHPVTPHPTASPPL